MTTTIAPSAAPTEPVGNVIESDHQDAQAQVARTRHRLRNRLSRHAHLLGDLRRLPVVHPVTPMPRSPAPTGDAGRYNWGPGSTAWFGTDGVSNDVFAKTIYGARTSLQVGVFATVFGIVGRRHPRCDRRLLPRLGRPSGDDPHRLPPRPPGAVARDHPGEPPRRLQGRHGVARLAEPQVADRVHPGHPRHGTTRPHRASPDALAARTRVRARRPQPRCQTGPRDVPRDPAEPDPGHPHRRLHRLVASSSPPRAHSPSSASAWRWARPPGASSSTRTGTRSTSAGGRRSSPASCCSSRCCRSTSSAIDSAVASTSGRLVYEHADPGVRP